MRVLQPSARLASSRLVTTSLVPALLVATVLVATGPVPSPLGTNLLGVTDAHAAKPPTAQPAELVVSGITGPEGIAFTKRDGFVVGTTTGDIIRIDRHGVQTVVANVGDSLAGITVTQDGTILAVAFAEGRVWAVTPNGAASILASGIVGANFVVESRRTGKIFASSSFGGAIVEISSGVPVTVATGLVFANGLHIARDEGTRYLYVVETAGGTLSRFPLDNDDELGPIELVASGFPLADGVIMDRGKNILVVGGGVLNVYNAQTGLVEPLLEADPLFDFPTNMAFGRGRGFKRRDVYMPNYGFSLGDGTEVIKFRYSHRQRVEPR